MKILDKILSKFKTDRNTFFTYILTLLSAYVLIDRIAEMLLLWFTGMSISYWGPIQYTLAIACVTFAYHFSYPSKLCKSDMNKRNYFFSYCVALYIVGISMVVQWGNIILWRGIFAVPNYKIIFDEFSDLIIPAFTATALYLPTITFYRLFLWLYKTINDPIFPNEILESIGDYQGIDISVSPIQTGPYSYEVTLCKDRITGKPVKILEKHRVQTTLIVGPSGTGKTSLVMHPLMAQDLEKKFFFRESAKELGYEALKSGLATLNRPYNKDYLDKYFNLKMLTPVQGKEKKYEEFMKKLIYAKKSDGTIVFRDLGFSYLTPDFKDIEVIANIAKNFNIPVTIIDPMDKNSIGLNPFLIASPALCALCISAVLKGLFGAPNTTAELAYMQDVALQAIQNIVMLLKVIFPKLNDGLMPNLEDLLQCLTNFDNIENMCNELKKDPELVKEYALQLSYFEENFYKNSPNAQNMRRYVHFATGQLDTLLRSANVRDIICNRYNNINPKQMLDNGEITLICSRPTDIMGTPAAGFGKFFLFFMMCGVEQLPVNYEGRIPNYLYVDDFEEYANEALDMGDTFNVFRKFNVGTIFSTSNLSNLGGTSSGRAQDLIANSPTKLSFGNCSPEDYAWWEEEFGKRREWFKDNKYDMSEGAYSENLGNVKWSWKSSFEVAKIQGLKFKGCIYKVKNKYGKNVVNYGSTDFVASKYKEPQKMKFYNFQKFSTAITENTNKDENKKSKFDLKHISFGTSDTNIDPVQIDTTDSSFLFNNEDAISYNVKKKK